MLSTKKEVTQWLKDMEITNYVIHDDLSVDVNGHVNLQHKKLTAIEVQFNRVLGVFCCRDNQLTSLQGVPYFVGGSFECEHNCLINYQYVPHYVKHSFVCSGHVDLQDLVNLNVGDNFAHLYKKDEDKIELFSEFYDPYGDGFVFNIQAQIFNQHMNVFKMMKEKEFLDNVLNQESHLAYKIKI